MTTYDFSLYFTLPSRGTDTDDIIERLYESGCDDALVGIGQPGSIALDFTREARSAHEAVMSAIADVAAAIPGVVLVEATPDLVGVSDIAELVGCSRQNIRQLIVSCSGPAPEPAHVGKQSLWHLAPVLDWLVRDKRYRVGEDLVDLASTTMRVNIAMDALRADPDVRDELQALFA